MESCRSVFADFMKGKKMADSMGPRVGEKYLDAVAKGELAGKKTASDVVMDAVAETSVSGLLSNPASWLIQIVSGVTQSVLMPMVRLSQGLVQGGPFTKAGKESLADAGAMLFGAVQGYKEFVPFLLKGWANGLPIDIDFTKGLSQKELRALLRNAGLTEDSSPRELNAFLKDRYDYINQGIPSRFGGGFIRLPTRIIVALDEGMKAVFRRQKYNALAFRKAMELTDNGTKGDPLAEWNKLIGVNLADEAESQKAWKFIKGKDDSDMGELSALYRAQDYAKMNAFQQELFGAARQMQKYRAEHKILVFAIPFLKSPYNILKEGVTFVPGLGYFGGKFYKKATSVTNLGRLDDAQRVRFLELSDKLNMNKAEAAELRKLQKLIGPTRYEKMETSEIMGRQLLGFGAAVTAYAMFDEGLITGKMPEDPAEREAWRANGIPEFSIRVGDKWISYRKIEPLSTVFGLMSDQYRLWDEYFENAQDPNIEEWERYVAATHGSLVQNIMGKSFMEGLSNIVNLATAGATGNSGQELQNIAANLGRVVVPYGAFLNSVAISMDRENAPSGKAWDRQATTVLEKLQQRIPGFRESLPLMYGIYGEARKLDIIDVWDGIKTVDDVDKTALQEELATLGVAYAPIDRTIKTDMKLNNNELGQLREVSAQMITPMLENMISAPGWRTLPNSLKDRVFKDTMRAGRSAAMKVFIGKNIGVKDFEKRYMFALLKNKGLQDLMTEPGVL